MTNTLKGLIIEYLEKEGPRATWEIAEALGFNTKLVCVYMYQLHKLKAVIRLNWTKLKYRPHLLKKRQGRPAYIYAIHK